MPIKDRSIKKQLDNTRLLLKNISKEDILKLMIASGYTGLEELKDLYANAQHWMEKNKQAKMDYRQAKSRFQKASQEAREFFIDVIVLARRNLSNDLKLPEIRNGVRLEVRQAKLARFSGLKSHTGKV